MWFERKRFYGLVIAAGTLLCVSTGCKKEEKPVPKRVTLNALPIAFFDAKNLNTKNASYREYEEVSGISSGNGVPFIRMADKKQIDAGTPEYDRVIGDWDLITGPQDIESVTVDPEKKQDYPLVKFKSDGANKWQRWSMANNRRGEKIAAVVGGRVLIIVPIPDGSVVNGEIQLAVSPKLITR